ncbi:aminopeptidase N [Streptomyces gamaensis]|uniref:Aminopeptidase N n=1 Tax=Streptomyces gamaensis TaxID=1763542 RepID=A0ABW0Z2K6_9ACTN
MPALTRDEAQNRARLLDVHHCTVDLDLTRGDEHFASTAVIRFTARTDGDTFVEIKPATLHRITLDGTHIDPARLDDNRIPLQLNAGQHELRVEADMRYSRTGEGMHRFTDPADGETYTYTQLFMEDVQRVFAAFDQPDLKAVFEASVTAPAQWTVLGNAIATPTPTGQDTTTRWQFAPTQPISTYLVAFAAGPWHSVRTQHAGLPFGLHCRRSLAPYLDADATEILDITRRCYDRYHELFDEPYPFDSYDQAFVPEFNAGAMENPGLVTFRDEFLHRSAVTDTERQLRGIVIAHEMAHMWFGDLVTLTWWDDIWLNESFAEYMGYQVLGEATRFTDTWTGFAIDRKSWGYDADQRPSTHPVAPATDAVHDTSQAMLNFDGISYAKGASALRQLVAWLGEKDFLAGINDHFARHRFANATLADFIDSLARATTRDVHAWAERWLRTTGVDTLTPDITTTADAWHLTVRHQGIRPHHLAIGLYDETPTGQLALRERVETDLTPETGSDHALHFTGPRPALLLLNDQDLTYAKVRLDHTSWNTALRSLSRLDGGDNGADGALTRAVLWNAARDMVRDGELAPERYLDAARAHLPHENDNAIVQGVLAFARTHIADHCTTPADRPTALATITTLCHDLLHRTDSPATGVRLTAVRALIDSATDPRPLQDWLREGTTPGTIPLDPELRWRVLARLAVLGAIDENDITAELTRDPSATGQEGAARCRASLPDPTAKEAAWHAMYDPQHRPELSNYLFAATAQGFWRAEQPDLLRPYVERYYHDAVALAARRGPAIAALAGRQGFPHTLVEHRTLHLGEECLRTGEPGPSLRRHLADQLDDLRRALTARTAQHR